MKYTVILSEEAKADYDEIFDYIKGYDLTIATNYTDDLLQRINMLSDMPFLGKETADNHFRRIVKKTYVVYYEVNEGLQTVTILYIRHGARKPLK